MIMSQIMAKKIVGKDDTEKDNTEKDNTEKDDTKSKTNEWGSFARSVLQIFIQILILGLLGANFVYFTRISLDSFFPSEPAQQPYVNETKSGNKLPPVCSPSKKSVKEVASSVKAAASSVKAAASSVKAAASATADHWMDAARKKAAAVKKAATESVPAKAATKASEQKGGGKSNSGCGIPIDFCQSDLFKNKYFSGMFEYGFPYSMESKGDTFGGIISNWFVNKVKYSYIWLRQVINAIINFTGSTCAMAPDSMKSIVPFILGPFAILLIIGIASMWWLPTLISMFWNEDQEWKGFLISILGLFFGWTWFIPIVLSFIQMIGIMFSFIVLPPLLNGKKIMEIIGEKFNSYYLTLLFLILLIVSAFSKLNPIIAIVMTLVFLKHMIPPGMSPFAKKNEK